MRFNKIQWVKSLQVGDMVCDCRYKHLRIMKIDDFFELRLPNFLRRLLTYFPPNIEYVMSKILMPLLGRSELLMRDLILEDGQSCSAYHCCDPVDHLEKTHPENRQ